MQSEIRNLLNHQQQTKCAVHIQAIVRGWLVRKNTQKSTYIL